MTGNPPRVLSFDELIKTFKPERLHRMRRSLAKAVTKFEALDMTPEQRAATEYVREGVYGGSLSRLRLVEREIGERKRKSHGK